MASPQGVFERMEKKYMLSPEQFDIVQKALSEHMQLDQYGLSTICSIYFDTENRDLIRRSIEKPIYKEKLRLRCYGRSVGDDDKVFIEIKKKFGGIVFKRRISVKYIQAREYLFEGGPCPQDSQIAREIDWFVSFYKPRPATLVCYDRLAYYGLEDSELRVTFDLNVRCRADRLTLHEGDDGDRIIPEGYAIMEIKTTGAMPLWLCRLLSENRIYPTSFSKYGTYYKMTHARDSDAALANITGRT